MSEEKRTVERLSELLDLKDAELEEVRKELEKMQVKEEWQERCVWMVHRHVPEEDDAPGLPVPRLQIRFDNGGGDNWYSYNAVYELVYRHYLGRMGGKLPEGEPNLIAVPLGSTRINGSGRPDRFGKIDLPLRDGTHIISDAEHLKLPMFAVLEGKAERIEPRELNIKPGR